METLAMPTARAGRATPRAGPRPGHTATIPIAGEVESAVYSLLRDAKMVGCAPRSLLTPHLEWLVEAQDEVARAIEKVRS